MVKSKGLRLLGQLRPLQLLETVFSVFADIALFPVQNPGDLENHDAAGRKEGIYSSLAVNKAEWMQQAGILFHKALASVARGPRFESLMVSDVTSC